MRLVSGITGRAEEKDGAGRGGASGWSRVSLGRSTSDVTPRTPGTSLLVTERCQVLDKGATASALHFTSTGAEAEV